MDALALPTPTQTPNYSGARDDDHLVALWLNGFESHHTRRAYASDVADFRAHVGKTMNAVTLSDVAGWPALHEGAPATRARRLNSVKSLLSFACRAGYLPYNVGAAFKGPKIPNTLTERIMPEADVALLLRAAQGRDRALIRLLYASGARVSEVLALDWRHVQALGCDGAILTLHGKGGKTRHVLIDQGTLEDLGERGGDDEPLFRAESGARLAQRTAHQIVAKIALRAQLTHKVSPHWLRHCAASHALDRGASPALVQASLGHSSLQTTSKYLHARPRDGLARYLSL